MSDQAQHYIHCMLIPLNQHYLLLPNSTISEVIPKAGVQEQLPDDISWLGFIDWQEQRIPVVYLERLLDDNQVETSNSTKFCLLNGINTEAGISTYAIPCSGSPQLITLNQAALHLTHGDSDSPSLHCQIKISNKVALIPNLDAIERGIKQLL